MAFVDLLADNPLLLLFTVSAAGVVIGRINVGGFSIGIAAVLFVGIAFSAVDERLVLPEFVFMFGLAVFVYMIGLASGPGFVAALRRQGVRDNLLPLGVVVVGFVLALVLGLDPALGAGLFAGSTTNTPALAAVIESVRQVGGTDPALPVVAYTLTYPIGVLGATYAAQRLWRIDYHAEAARLPRGRATTSRVWCHGWANSPTNTRNWTAAASTSGACSCPTPRWRDGPSAAWGSSSTRRW